MNTESPTDAAALKAAWIAANNAEDEARSAHAEARCASDGSPAARAFIKLHKGRAQRAIAAAKRAWKIYAEALEGVDLRVAY